jgi:excisionase family DNA binding protein
MEFFEEQRIKPQVAADLVGVTVYTIMNWLKAGKLKGTKIGGRYFTSESALREFVRAASK